MGRRAARSGCAPKGRAWGGRRGREKAARRCRDEVGSNLKQMADYLEVPPSYLSAIEHGQKKVPKKIIEKTWEYFSATGPTMDEWLGYAEKSPTHVKLDMASANDLERDVYMAVGRKFQ